MDAPGQTAKTFQFSMADVTQRNSPVPRHFCGKAGKRVKTDESIERGTHDMSTSWVSLSTPLA